MEQSSIQRWVRTAVFTGLLAAALYPILILVSLPTAVAALCGCMFGLAFGIAAVGLYHVLALQL